MCLVLGDNIFYGEGFSNLLKSAKKNAENKNRATVFGYHVKDLTLEGGSGSDTFEITKTNLFNNEYCLTQRRDVNNQPITDTSFIISDFQTGVGGDFLDISALLTALTNNYSGNNPFQDYFHFRADGNDAVLSVDLDGNAGTNYTAVDVVTLKNVLLADITAENITLGFALDGTPIDGVLTNLSQETTAQTLSGGACVGLVGWGGAQFIIPGVAYMGHSQLAAAGVSLCSVSVSSISGAAKFMASDSVSPSHALGMAVPAVITARLGSVLAKRLTDVQLQLAFNGLSAALIPTYLAVQHYAQTRDAEKDAPQDAAAPLRRTLTEHQALHRTADAECDAEARGPAGLASRLLPLRPQDMAFGALSGVLSSLVGVGGLPIAMSYLTVSTDLPHHLVQGTAVLAVAPSVLVS